MLGGLAQKIHICSYTPFADLSELIDISIYKLPKGV